MKDGVERENVWSMVLAGGDDVDLGFHLGVT